MRICRNFFPVCWLRYAVCRTVVCERAGGDRTVACVPLIPAAIAAVQTLPKKLLSKYWGQYTSLGDTFLENLQGLTALKIYESDGWKQEQMDRESGAVPQNYDEGADDAAQPITIMDLVAYGGAAAGMAVAVTQLAAERCRFPDVCLSC